MFSQDHPLSSDISKHKVTPNTPRKHTQVFGVKYFKNNYFYLHTRNMYKLKTYIVI